MLASPTLADDVIRMIANFPPEAQQEVLDFVVFVSERLRRTNTERAWDAALENTTPEQAARINARIESQRAQTTPLFDASGKVAPPRR